jgi:hypothetical protein
LYVILPITAALIGLFPVVGDAIAAHLAPSARLLPLRVDGCITRIRP